MAFASTAFLCRYAGPVYAIALAGFAAIRLAALPIGEGDTDVWYHLNSGRYIAEMWRLPQESFFSFLEPPRAWTDYYWLFQVIAYGIYSQLSFPGLIALPALAYALTLYFVYRLLSHATVSFLGVAVFALYAMFLLQRFQLIRPHVFTYLLIVATLFVLERGTPRVRLVLPVLALLWVNVHGVTYPVLLLIGFSYAADLVADRLRTRHPFVKADLLTLAPIALAMFAVHVTPHGNRLLEVPFVPTAAASSYIGELRPLQLDELFVFNLWAASGTLADPTVRNILVALVVLALLRGLLTRSLRLSHVLLVIGGFGLLLRGSRFSYEFVLLALPLLGATPWPRSPLTIATRWTVALATAVAAVIPFSILHDHFSDRPVYPVSQSQLPHGIVKFLTSVNVGGRVLNHPNNGGYLQWALGDRYKIYMDMEVPFLFTNEDFYLISRAYSDPTILQLLVTRHRPDFIAVPLRHAGGRSVLEIGAPEYVLVFFDDVEALYVHRGQHPAIAEHYTLGDLDPFALAHATLNSMSIATLRGLVERMERVLAIHPENALANNVIGLVRQHDGHPRLALNHAERILKHHPQALQGYVLKAETLAALGRFDDASRMYQEAIARSGGGVRTALSKRLGVVLFEAGAHERAYRVLRAATNVFAPETTHEDLYYLGAAMFESGRPDQAAVIFHFGLQSLPDGDGVWAARYRAYLDRLRNSGVSGDKSRAGSVDLRTWKVAA